MDWNRQIEEKEACLLGRIGVSVFAYFVFYFITPFNAITVCFATALCIALALVLFFKDWFLSNMIC